VSTVLNLETFGSPEAALLMAASSGNPSSASVRRLMERPIDWALLTRLAVESHATVALWEVVSGFPGLPGEAKALQSIAVINDFRRNHIRNFVARISRELELEGIQVLVMKGAALLIGGVSRPNARTMSDIDLLVVSGSPDKAWELCRRRGWTLVDDVLTPELYREHHHLPPLVDPDGVNIGLELHRILLPGLDLLGLDVGGIVERSRLVHVGNTAVRVPSVEDLLVHACLHFAWSNKLRHAAWRAFSDCHAIISDPTFNWDRFLAALLSRRAKQCCYWSLRLGRVVADLDVPDDVLARLDSSTGRRMATLLERHFVTQLADHTEEAEIAERVQRWLWLAALGESSSREAERLFSLGALEVSGPGGSAHRRRGALTAALKTGGYFARLLTRG
jgi:hypothetical protein